MHLWHSFAANQNAASENQKFSSEDVVGFFRGVLALYAPRLLKNGALIFPEL